MGYTKRHTQEHRYAAMWMKICRTKVFYTEDDRSASAHIIKGAWSVILYEIF